MDVYCNTLNLGDMKMKEKYKEDVKYKVDLKQTFYANIFWLAGILIMTGVILLLVNRIELLEDEVNRLLGLLIIVFAAIKLLSWLGSPHIHFKEK